MCGYVNIRAVRFRHVYECHFDLFYNLKQESRPVCEYRAVFIIDYSPKIQNIMEGKTNRLEFRTLRADEIECRVGQCTDKGVSLLMYKNARVDMTLLDEVVGPENWKRSHELINGNLFCTVEVRLDGGDWVSKQDVGTESNTEKEKGQASDAFKRACVNWGIGRELYTCPFVWVNLSNDEWRVGYGGKKQPKVRFAVKDIEYDKERRVSYLIVVDDHDRVRYKFGNPSKGTAPQVEAVKDTTAEDLNKKREEVIRRIKAATCRKEVEAIYREFKDIADASVVDACTQKCLDLDNEAA